MTWERYLPVMVSITIIILIAILREYSRQIAAITATMPLNIPLGMWIVYAGSEDKQAALKDFTQAVLVNIIPTLVFMVIAWQGSKASWQILPIIGAGYLGWGVTLGVTLVARHWLMI